MAQARNSRVQNITRGTQDRASVRIEHELNALMRQLGHHRDRLSLEADEAFMRSRAVIEEVVNSMAYDLTATPGGNLAKGSAGRALRAVNWNVERGRQLDSVKELLQRHPYLANADLVLLTE